MKKRKLFFLNFSLQQNCKNQYLGKIYTENYKTLQKEVKEVHHIHGWEDTTLGRCAFSQNQSNDFLRSFKITAGFLRNF